jgi:hypothetical protein
MNILRKAVTTLGGVFLAALLITALAPKAARGVAAALVQVTNTSANPVPTVSADTNFPYEAMLCTGNNCDNNPNLPIPASFTVPSTTTTGVPVKRLVIEDLNATCPPAVPGPGPGLVSLLVPTSADSTIPGSGFLYSFVLTPVAGDGVGNAIVRIYVDPSASVRLNSSNCTAVVTGHLETK